MLLGCKRGVKTAREQISSFCGRWGKGRRAKIEVRLQVLKFPQKEIGQGCRIALAALFVYSDPHL